jgi:hypothetical protein
LNQRPRFFQFLVIQRNPELIASFYSPPLFSSYPSYFAV